MQPIFQIVFLPDPGAGAPYYYDHCGPLASTVEVIRGAHMDSWYADDSYIGYDSVIESNLVRLQAFESGKTDSVFITVPFGQVCAFNSGAQ